MKKYIIAVFSAILLVSNVVAVGQTEGIKFNNNLSWTSLLKKAKEENKLVFMDCYTTWCGPCKMMSQKIFPRTEIGNYFNDRFISIQIQMDSTGGDNDDIRNWYQDAKRIMHEQKIDGFPTYLFFTSEGKLIHRGQGYIETPQDFIDIAKKAQIYPKLLNEYQQGAHDTSFLKELTLAALDISDTSISGPASKEYMKKLGDIYTKDNLFFIAISTKSSIDTGFKIFLNNSLKIDKIEGRGFSIHVYGEIINKEEIKPALLNGIDWSDILLEVKRKYPGKGEEVVRLYHFTLDMDTQNWVDYGKDVSAYMRKYSNKWTGDAAFFNLIAFSTCEHCDDRKVLRSALRWAKYSIGIKEDKNNLDTFASLLYKVQQRDKAIIWEERALAADPSDQEIQLRLNKMKEGGNL
jgi:thioredoxin-related protein